MRHPMGERQSRLLTSCLSLGIAPLVCGAESRRVGDGNTMRWNLAHSVIHRRIAEVGMGWELEDREDTD
jgi:hypothetical protein